MKIQYSHPRLADLKMKFTPEGIPVVRESWVDDSEVPEEPQMTGYLWFNELYKPREKQIALVSHAREFCVSFFDSQTAPELHQRESVTNLENEFRSHAESWLQETGLLSDPVKIFMHPSHLKIIGMGKDVLPLILKEVERGSGHWFVALNAISPVNPVASGDENDIQRVTDSWLSWGRAEGLI